ncbi:hypothetical protein BDC45DRAFT_539870 [Circinella umbellata]|nr:hypothetical protein BDC45DRAFT_539870 [Circinella umbellata]
MGSKRAQIHVCLSRGFTKVKISLLQKNVKSSQGSFQFRRLHENYDFLKHLISFTMFIDCFELIVTVVESDGSQEQTGSVVELEGSQKQDESVVELQGIDTYNTRTWLYTLEEDKYLSYCNIIEKLGTFQAVSLKLEPKSLLDLRLLALNHIHLFTQDTQESITLYLPEALKAFTDKYFQMLTLFCNVYSRVYPNCSRRDYLRGMSVDYSMGCY